MNTKIKKSKFSFRWSKTVKNKVKISSKNRSVIESIKWLEIDKLLKDENKKITKVVIKWEDKK